METSEPREVTDSSCQDFDSAWNKSQFSLHDIDPELAGLDWAKAGSATLSRTLHARLPRCPPS